MKQRIITGVIIILALVPIFYFKLEYDYNEPIYILGLILTIVATSEMISMKETENKLPFLIRLVMYFAVLFISFNPIFSEKLDYSFSYDIFPLIIIIVALTMVLREKFKLNDASFVVFTIYYIGLSFLSLISFFTKGVDELLYIVLIAIFTDTFAYFAGNLFGKHKLAPKISPKKTIEGSIGGTLMATILVSTYAYFFMDDTNLFIIIPITLFLTIMSQFGDLIASVMKREYKIKDYGNLFPGHGGVLDRLDSILFTSLTYFYLKDIINLLFNA